MILNRPASSEKKSQELPPRLPMEAAGAEPWCPEMESLGLNHNRSWTVVPFHLFHPFHQQWIVLCDWRWTSVP
jgi:hypothetical protein